MIHQVQWCRDRLIRLIDRTLHEFQSGVSLLPILEEDILRELTPDARLALATQITGILFKRFGHENVIAKAPRFDKIRRAARRKNKPPRGLKAGMSRAEKRAARAQTTEASSGSETETQPAAG